MQILAGLILSENEFFFEAVVFFLENCDLSQALAQHCN
jgi:hypothetical protein